MEGIGFFFVILILLAIVVGSIIAAVKILTRGSAERARLIREAPNALSANAAVIGKRTQISGHETTYTEYFVTFDIEGIGRAEFNVAGSFSGLIVEGDRGIIRYLLNPLRIVNFTPASQSQQVQQIQQ